jgi:hypothetical protein
MISIASMCTVYSMSSLLQRQHLFIWSVFAPKLIFLLANLILEMIICINMVILFETY